MQYELVDTHCHLIFEPLISQLELVFTRSVEAGITRWINVGTTLQEDKKAIELAHKYKNLYAAVGIHPHFAKDSAPEDIVELKEIAKDKKVVAIGETGLDFHYNFSDRISQRQLFISQLNIAEELQLPVIVHCREAFDETIKVIDEMKTSLRIVFHCFTGTAKQAKALLERGFYISFTGTVTFKNADAIRQAAKIVPTNRLMIETDCPYMSPEPMRKQKVNEPSLMIHTARFLAELKGIPFEQFAQQVKLTTEEFFKLPDGD